MAYTNGYDPLRMHDHYQRHAARLKIYNIADYVDRADHFCGGPRKVTTIQLKRSRGDIVRYDLWTKEFGILSTAGIVRTYYRPDPSHHGYPLNVCYFLVQAKRY